MNIEARHLSLVEEFRSRHRAGLMTLVFTDLVDSVKLKTELGDAVGGALVDKHHNVLRDLLKTFPLAREISTAGDSFFLVFDSPSNAVLFALRLHTILRTLSKKVGYKLQDRVGIDVGEVFVESGNTAGPIQNYSGIHVDTCSRVMSVCEPGRILLTRFAFENARQVLGSRPEGMGELVWGSHGLYEIKGVAQPLEICEVLEKGKVRPKPLADAEKAKRFVGPATSTGVVRGDILSEQTHGWLAVIADRAREIVTCTALAWVVVLFVIFSPIGSILEGISYDFGYYDISQMGHERPIPKEALIVYMDEESHGILNQPDNAPWDHAVHARLIDRMTAAGAKAVVFDVLFVSNQPTSGALVKACRDNGHVFVAALEKGVRGKTSITPPFEELRSAVSYGVVESAPLSRTARRQYGVRGDNPVPTLAELVAENVRPGSVARARGRWLNYYGPPRALPNVSFHQALSTTDTPDDLFRDKVVFVGALPFLGYTGGRGTNDYARDYDEFATPYTGREIFGKAAGVELNATSTLNLIRGESLRQISPWMEFTIFLVTAGLTAILVGSLPTAWAMILGALMAVAIALGSGWLVWSTHEWYSWAVISFVEIPAVILCALTMRIQTLSRQKRELERTLASQQSEFATKASQMHTDPAVQQLHGPVASMKAKIPDHELFSPIGKGAYGEVWLAQDLTSSFHAVKIVRAKNFTSEGPFEREFEGIKRFAPLSRSHPGLVDVLHVGISEQEDWFYYIMEAADDLMTGRQIDPARYLPKSLSSLLDGNRRLEPGQTLSLGIQLAEALDHLHAHGLLHRDIKPANVLYVHGRPQLADPGLVAGASEGGANATMVGTAGYMAPDATASAASDIYSLGKVLYQAGYGRPVAAFPELPTFLAGPEQEAFLTALNEVILKACARDPKERYASALELRDDLEELGNQLGLTRKNLAAPLGAQS